MIVTESGRISGDIVRYPSGRLHVYRGIPYAARPIGSLRWKAPEAAVPWAGVRECTRFADSCAQLSVAWPGFDFPQSEDCLTLNILTGAVEANERLPVMVAFHGGGYVVGSANERLYGLPHLPAHGVVLVSVNTRLGVFGLLGHPLLSAESPHGVSGNYMLLDLIAALEWVKRNIGAFGGDPTNVTIFGSSGGSWKAIDLMVSPLGAGLFEKAICSSGTPWGTSLTTPVTLEETEAKGLEFFAKLGVGGEKDPLAAARDLPWQTIIKADGDLLADAGLATPWCNWGVSLDGFVLPDTPLRTFKAGAQHPVAIIVGGNLGEIIEPIMPEIVPAYMQMLSSAVRIGTPAYAYIFDHVPSKWRAAGVPCTHGQELPYVFGDFDHATSAVWRCAQLLNGAKEQDPGITEADYRMSDLMAAMWTQFARTGDPSVPGVTPWPKFDLSTESYLRIGEPLRVGTRFSEVGRTQSR
jgi:para-nitrobenzyl esterase